MNYNHPFFKQIQKICRYFNVKPMFIHYDEKIDKVYPIPYRKRVHDEPNLVFINNVPCVIAYKIYKNKGKRYDENIFYKKTSKDIFMYTLHDIDGEVICIGYYSKLFSSCKREKDSLIEIMASNNLDDIINYFNEYKKNNPDKFKVE